MIFRICLLYSRCLDVFENIYIYIFTPIYGIWILGKWGSRPVDAWRIMTPKIWPFFLLSIWNPSRGASFLTGSKNIPWLNFQSYSATQGCFCSCCCCRLNKARKRVMFQEQVTWRWINTQYEYRNMGLSKNRVYSQWNSHLIGIMISKTIGFRGLAYFQTNPYGLVQWLHMVVDGGFSICKVLPLIVSLVRIFYFYANDWIISGDYTLFVIKNGFLNQELVGALEHELYFSIY